MTTNWESMPNIITTKSQLKARCLKASKKEQAEAQALFRGLRLSRSGGGGSCASGFSAHTPGSSPNEITDTTMHTKFSAMSRM